MRIATRTVGRLRLCSSAVRTGTQPRNLRSEFSGVHTLAPGICMVSGASSTIVAGVTTPLRRAAAKTTGLKALPGWRRAPARSNWLP